MLQTSLFFHFRAKHAHLIYKQPSTDLEIKAKMGAHWSTTDLKTITGQGEISSFSILMSVLSIFQAIFSMVNEKALKTIDYL